MICPQILFTDGACEDLDEGLQVSYGALLWDAQDGTFHTFGVIIENPLKEEWLSTGKRQLVTEAELLPVLIARRT